FLLVFFGFFFSSRRRHTRSKRDWSSDVCSSDLGQFVCRRSSNGTSVCWSAVSWIPAAVDSGSVVRFCVNYSGHPCWRGYAAGCFWRHHRGQYYWFCHCPVLSQDPSVFSAVLSCTVITAVGLTLFPVAADWAMGGDETADDYGSMMNIGLAVITFIIIMIFSKVGVATLSRLSILLGLVVGTIIAVFMGRTD